MKRLMTAMLVLLYAVFSVVLTVERASSFASTVLEATKSRTVEIRPHSPHPAYNKRILEDPFVVSLDRTTFARPECEAHTRQLRHPGPVNNANDTALSRAPPALL